jgi:hypothetical protein
LYLQILENELRQKSNDFSGLFESDLGHGLINSPRAASACRLFAPQAEEGFQENRP